jgi:hypothetical protein
VEARLTLVAARCEGAERRRRRRGGGRRRGSEGSGERWGGPVTRAEAREVAAVRHRSGEGKIAARWRKFDRRRLHFKGERHGGGRRGGRRVEAERERGGPRCGACGRRRVRAAALRARQ